MLFMAYFPTKKMMKSNKSMLSEPINFDNFPAGDSSAYSEPQGSQTGAAVAVHSGIRNAVMLDPPSFPSTV